MYRLRFLLSIAATLFFSLALCSTTQAAVARTFVSVAGNDANPCTLPSPCRLFQRGHDAVDAGGEVVAITSGGYGSFTISKSVTISGVGVTAVASPNSTESAITITAAGQTVVLRSITVKTFGAGTGGFGISVGSVGKLQVENCVISGFAFTGIAVSLVADASQIFIKDTIVRNNSSGISFATSTGLVYASIDNCLIERNSVHGLVASFNSRVTVNRSVASGNTSGAGFNSFANGAGTTTELSCEKCVSSNNSIGFYVNPVSGGAATIRVSHSTATNNGAGFFQDTTGVFNTLGNNMVQGNGSDTTGTITPIGLQ